MYHVTTTYIGWVAL